MIGRFLNRPLRANTAQITLQPGDTLYVVSLRDGFGHTYRPRGYRNGERDVTFSIMRVIVQTGEW